MAEDFTESGTKKAERLVAEAETGGRTPQGIVKWLIFGLAIAWSLFQLAIASFWVLDATRSRAIHLAFAIVLTFLVFPFNKKAYYHKIPWYDYLGAIVGALTTLYLVIDYVGIQERFGLPLKREVVIGTVFLLLLLEATRRSLGPALAAIAGIFLLYALTGPRGLIPITLPELIAHRGYNLDRIISQMFITTEGVFGVALGVSTQFVFLYVLFGSLLDKVGAGKYFVDLANAFLGVFRGGPAKASVLASGLMGLVSGSSLANVVTTGTFTIPLMKRSGYPAVKAAATEVAVSTNGQLMPPVMGAAAFIMAEFTGQPYFEIVRAAFIPAFISYLALFYIVHLEALKLGLQGLPRSELPPRKQTFLQGMDNLIPLAFLIWGIVIRRLSPGGAVMYAIALVVLLQVLKSVVIALTQKQPLKPSLSKAFHNIITGLELGARNMVGIAVAVATAGVVVGVVNLTGLGLRLTEIIISVSAWFANGIGWLIIPVFSWLGNNPETVSNYFQFVLVLLMTALASLILGLGLPTTANYIVMATLTAPVIVQIASEFNFAVPLLGAHLFVFFFGILADDTPPVGIAAYAAAAIARSNPIATGIQGFIYDLRTAILPFLFIFNSKLLLIGVESWYEGVWIFITAVIAMFAFASATQGYLIRRSTWLERIILIIATLLLFNQHLNTDLLGIFLIVGVLAWQWRDRFR